MAVQMVNLGTSAVAGSDKHQAAVDLALGMEALAEVAAVGDIVPEDRVLLGDLVQGVEVLARHQGKAVTETLLEAAAQDMQDNAVGLAWEAAAH